MFLLIIGTPVREPNRGGPGLHQEGPGQRIAAEQGYRGQGGAGFEGASASGQYRQQQQQQQQQSYVGKGQYPGSSSHSSSYSGGPPAESSPYSSRDTLMSDFALAQQMNRGHKGGQDEGLSPRGAAGPPSSHPHAAPQRQQPQPGGIDPRHQVAPPQGMMYVMGKGSLAPGRDDKPQSVWAQGELD